MQVALMVERYSRQSLRVETGPPNPSRIKAGWRFYSLLGAMCLQLYWLMASDDEITRCEHCGRIVSLARPYPEARKTRRDKRFCDDACRQARHRSKKQATSADASGSNLQQHVKPRLA